MYMPIRIYYMYISTGFNSTPPESPSTWGTAKQGSLKRQDLSGLMPAQSIAEAQNEHPNLDESLDPHLSYSKVLRLNSIWKRRKRCRNVPKILPIEWPTKVGNQRIASQILGGSKAMFLCFETPWKTHSPIFLALQGKIRIVFRLLCF